MLMDLNSHKTGTEEPRGLQHTAPLNCTWMRVKPPPTVPHSSQALEGKGRWEELLSGTTAGSVCGSPPGSCCLSYMGLQTACYKGVGWGVPDHWGPSAQNSVSSGTRYIPNGRWQKALTLTPQLPALRGEPHYASAMNSSSLQHRRIHGVSLCDGAVRSVKA